MSWFRDLTLRSKLLLSFGVILFWVLLQGVFAFSTALSNDSASNSVEHSLRVISRADEMRSGLVNMQTGYRGFLLTGQEQYLEAYEAGRNAYEASLISLQRLTDDNPEQLARWSDISARADTWRSNIAEPDIQLRRNVRDGIAEMPEGLAFEGLEQDKPAFDEIRSSLNDAIASEEELLSERSALAAQRNTQLRQAIIVGSVGIVVLALAMAYLLSRNIVGAVERLSVVAQQVTNGDLSQRIDSDRRDEIGQASSSFDAMAARLQAMVGELQDVAEESRANELRARTIMNTAAEGIMTIDEHGRIIETNPAAAGILHTSVDRLSGQPVRRFLQRLLDARILQGSPQSSAEIVGNRWDGSSFVAETTVRQMSLEEHSQYVVVVRDVSDRKQAEADQQRLYRQTLRAQGQMRAILDATNDIIIFVAPDRRVTMVNRSFGDMLGINPDDVIGVKMEELAAAVDRVFGTSNRFNRRILTSVSNTTETFEDIITQHWPERRELQMFSSPVHDGSGEHLGRLYVFRDVTHQREVDRMKTEFVSLVSHELRTPLTSIKGYVDLILDGEVGDVTEDQAAFLTIVATNAQRLVTLINDLLDISRIESGKIELRRTSFDLARTVSGVVSSFRPQVDAKQQTLTVTLPDNLPQVWADADRVTQIITNLVSNAHKYTPAGGSIDVCIERSGTDLLVEIKDSGIGLTFEEQSQLFTKFYRAHNRTTQEVGGTGLGLAITRSLVEMHGGTITVSSAPGEGSTFAFTLPAYLGTGELSAGRQSRAHGGRILVVEDDKDIAHLVRRYLERAGYSVTIAMNGVDALREIQTAPPDLITLDVILPDTDGFKILEQLQSDELTADIPVMLLSMMPDDGLGQRMGAVGFLAKPVHEASLLDQVHHFLPQAKAQTILVADDDQDIRELVAGQVRRAGHTVIEATNGQEAFDLARTNSIDLALIDVKMPIMDGIETLRHIRADPDICELPVIMMTVSPGVLESSRSSIEMLGASMFVAKTFNARELADMISRAVPTRTAQ